jgi:putative transcriptional regulator
MKMKMSYKKLWKLLIDRDMKQTDLRKMAGISSSSLAKLGKDENVTTDVLLRICESLNVNLNDIVETVPIENK